LVSKEDEADPEKSKLASKKDEADHEFDSFAQ